MIDKNMVADTLVSVHTKNIHAKEWEEFAMLNGAMYLACMTHNMFSGHRINNVDHGWLLSPAAGQALLDPSYNWDRIR